MITKSGFTQLVGGIPSATFFVYRDVEQLSDYQAYAAVCVGADGFLGVRVQAGGILAGVEWVAFEDVNMIEVGAEATRLYASVNAEVQALAAGLECDSGEGFLAILVSNSQVVQLDLGSSLVYGVIEAVGDESLRIKQISAHGTHDGVLVIRRDSVVCVVSRSPRTSAMERL